MMLRRVGEIFFKSLGCFCGFALKEEMGLYTLRQAKSREVLSEYGFCA